MSDECESIHIRDRMNRIIPSLKYNEPLSLEPVCATQILFQRNNIHIAEFTGETAQIDKTRPKYMCQDTSEQIEDIT